MGKNLLITALRNLWKNKTYTAINLFGLSIAIACALIAYINLDYARSYNLFHENKDTIYRVLSLRQAANVSAELGIVPLPLGQALRQDVPELERVVQMEDAGSVVKYDNRAFDENILYSEDGFFEMFTFPLVSGRADLKNKNLVVITEYYARKYFGDENPLGKVLTNRFSNGYTCELTVSGVAKNCPSNSSIQFEIVASGEILLDAGLNLPGAWSYWTGALFIQTKPGTPADQVERRLTKYLAPQQAAAPQNPLSGFRCEPLRKIADRSHNLRSNSLRSCAPASMLYGVGIMGGLMLIMGCFNFINTALAFSGRRNREVGIRKVLGGQRWQLILQLLAENLVLCLLALGAGLVLTRIILPYFNDLYPFVQLTLNFTGNPWLFVFLLGLLVLTALGAGLYPAFITSSTQPAVVLKGGNQNSRVGFLMRALLTGQFGLAIIAVIGCVVFGDNARYNREFDTGFQKESILAFQVNDGNGYQALRNELLQQPDVESAGGTINSIYYGAPRRVVRADGTDRETLVYAVGGNYLETMRVKLLDGRFFKEGSASDQENSVVISALLAKELGWKKAAGKTLTVGDRSFTVIGVVEDIYTRGPWEPVESMLFQLAPPDRLQVLQVRVRPGTEGKVFAGIRQRWNHIFPEQPFRGVQEVEILQESIQLSQNVQTNFHAIGFAAISMACIGLFSLVSLRVASRARELSIRKVLGASVRQLMMLINREFIMILLAAMLIADLGGFFLIKTLLGAIFTYHTSFGAITLLYANLAVLLIAAVTISQRVWQRAAANPVTSLRQE